MKVIIENHKLWNVGKEIGMEELFGKKHYLFHYKNKSASLISIKRFPTGGFNWEIMLNEEEPKTFRYRNDALRYMYIKFLE